MFKLAWKGVALFSPTDRSVRGFSFFVALLTCLCHPIYAQNGESHHAVLSADVAPGVILISVSENGYTADYSWQYEIKPTAGSVRLTKAEHRKVDSKSNLAVQSSGSAPPATSGVKPDGRSPDGIKTALVENVKAGIDRVLISGTGPSVHNGEWSRKNRSVMDIRWSPNSQSLAILSGSEHYGKDPLGLLSGLSGHPIPHTALFLDILDVNSGNVVEYQLRKNIKYVSATIQRWTNASTRD